MTTPDSESTLNSGELKITMFGPYGSNNKHLVKTWFDIIILIGLHRGKLLPQIGLSTLESQQKAPTAGKVM